MIRKTAFSTFVIALALSLGSIAVTASTQAEIVAADAAGDANFVNGNGNSNLTPTDGPDTRPASIDGADLRQIRFSTSYDTVKIFNADGTVGQVVYNPTGFVVEIENEGAVLPTFGPSLIYRVNTNIAGCDVWFHAVVRGPNAAPGDPATRNELRTPAAAACPAAATLTAGLPISVVGDTITLSYPYTSFTGAWDGFLAPGKTVDPDGTFTNASNVPSVRLYVAPQPGTFVSAPSVDETARITSFEIGSDVPDNVVCAQQPAHPDCQA